VLADADRLGREQGMLAVVAEAKVAHAYIVLHADVEATQGDVERELDEAARLFEQAGDEGGLARALTFAGRLPFWRGEAALGLERLALAASHARAAGDRAQELDALASMLIVMVHGATPIATALQHADALERLTTGSSRADFTILAHRAELELALGHHDRAQELVQAAAQVAAELDLTVLRHVALARARGGLLLHRGDPVTAQHVLQEACDFLLGIGDMGHLVSILPYLADALFELGRIETIAAPLDLAADAVIPEDMDGQVGVRRARAKLHAARGEFDAAERVIREALALIEPTEFLSLHCEVLSDAAEIAVMAGRGADAVTALESALALHERRGATGFAEETRARLATVGENR
jgi:tetratricopeptide (TPR) repeat protein